MSTILANFITSTPTGNAPLLVNFTNDSTGDPDLPDIFSWNFGDGTTADTSDSTHIYRNPGSYRVDMTATYSGGGSDSTSTIPNYITVNHVTADFTSNYTGPNNAPLAIDFTSTSTGGADTWYWNFGDTTTASTENPSHTYLNPGTYTVEMDATNSASTPGTNSDSESKSNYITVNPVVADFVSDYSGPSDAPLTVDFTSTSSGAPDTWTWNFGDGSTASGAIISHTYNNPGSFFVDMTATNSISNPGTNTDTTVASVPITINYVNADFTSNYSGSRAYPLTIDFTNLSTGSPDTFVWNFGDGSSASTSAPSHIYSTSGTFTVDMTVTNSVSDPGTNTDSVSMLDYITVNGNVATPVITQPAGNYTSDTSTTITCSTSGASIYYTDNDSTPSADSTAYTGLISITKSETIKAIGIKIDWLDSAVASSIYTITVANPSISPAAGTYTSPQSATVTCATTDASVYYTLDGSTPGPDSTSYTGAITIATSKTVKAIGIKTGCTDSSVAVSAYIIAVPTPVILPAAGTYTGTQSATITCTTSDASIYYTLNGSTPTSGSTPYTVPISVATSETIKAIAIKAGYADSVVASNTYVITGTVATPVISPDAGTYTEDVTVSISCATPGAVIRDTTDGSTPTGSSPLYTGPFDVSVTETIKAIGIRADWTNSAIASAAYVIGESTPTISPATGAYMGNISVSITDPAAPPATVIYYTTNGSTPTHGSTVYTGPITVTSSQTIKAISARPGCADSGVASCTYSISTSYPYFSKGSVIPVSIITGSPTPITSVSQDTPGVVFSSFDISQLTNAPYDLNPKKPLLMKLFCSDIVTDNTGSFIVSVHGSLASNSPRVQRQDIRDFVMTWNEGSLFKNWTENTNGDATVSIQPLRPMTQVSMNCVLGIATDNEGHS